MRVSNPDRASQSLSERIWQRHRHAQGVTIVREINPVADSNKDKQISTAQAAWSSATLADFETFLATPQAKIIKGKDGAPDTIEDVLPSSPNIGANVPAEWQHKILHHDVARTHTEYSDELARVSRYGAYLVVAEVDGALKVPKDVRDGFNAWYKAYSDQVSAGLSAARAGAATANAERKVAVGQLNAQQTRVAQMLADGLITQELADAILGASAGDGEGGALVPA